MNAFGKPQGFAELAARQDLPGRAGGEGHRDGLRAPQAPDLHTAAGCAGLVIGRAALTTRVAERDFSEGGAGDRAHLREEVAKRGAAGASVSERVKEQVPNVAAQRRGAALGGPSSEV